LSELPIQSDQVEGTRRPVSFLAAQQEEWTAERTRESLLAAGYDSVEWTMTHVDDLLAPASALACQQDLVSGGEQAVEVTLRAIDAAAAAGIPVVNIVTGPNLWEDGAEPLASREGAAHEAVWSRILKELERICDHADGTDVKVALEPCWGTLAFNSETAQRVFDAVPISVCFDPSHFVMSGDDIPGLIGKWGDRIAHFHLKDAFGRLGREGEDFHFCLLGDGLVPWPEVFEALDRVGYEGALSVEFEAFRYYEQVLGGDADAAARLCRSQVSALLGAKS
jgi:sugar phosphate isomerase/epimerase